MNDREKQKILFRVEAYKLLTRSKILARETLIFWEVIVNINIQYPEEDFENLPWDKKEEAIQVMETAWNNMLACKAKLEVIDKDYTEFKNRVNKFYGREIMPPTITDTVWTSERENDSETYSEKSNLMDTYSDGDEDSADWWRKCE